MNPDTDLILHEIDPRTVKVYLCGDVHVGSEQFQGQEKAFRDFLSMVGDDPDAYVLFVGDLVDMNTKSSVSDVFSPMNPRQQLEYIADALKPLAEKGKILALLTGNHELRMAKETSIDPMYDIAVRLGIERVYRRDFAAVRVRMVKTKSQTFTYNIIAFHGASDTKMRMMANNIEGFDCIVNGHSHQPLSRIITHINLSQTGKITMKPVIHCTVCSWGDYMGYGARAVFQPQIQSRPQCLVLEWHDSQDKEKHIALNW